MKNLSPIIKIGDDMIYLRHRLTFRLTEFDFRVFKRICKEYHVNYSEALRILVSYYNSGLIGKGLPNV